MLPCQSNKIFLQQNIRKKILKYSNLKRQLRIRVAFLIDNHILSIGNKKNYRIELIKDAENNKMIDWKLINNKTFEDIAYDYISDTYSDLKWTPTKATRDGNKDGHATINNPIGVTIKYWYEAKYSINTDKSIPKSHLDSTLV